MGYKWKPSKSQRKAFAANMQNAKYAAAYYAKKIEKAEKRRAASKFDYDSAGGEYVPTREQHDFALTNYHLAITVDQQTAFNEVMSGYMNQSKVHHDYIHIVNEFRRATL